MEIENLPVDKKIILFDGVCNLCDASVQFIYKHMGTTRPYYVHTRGNLLVHDMYVLRWKTLLCGPLFNILGGSSNRSPHCWWYDMVHQNGLKYNTYTMIENVCQCFHCFSCTFCCLCCYSSHLGHVTLLYQLPLHYKKNYHTAAVVILFPFY